MVTEVARNRSIFILLGKYSKRNSFINNCSTDWVKTRSINIDHLIGNCDCINTTLDCIWLLHFHWLVFSEAKLLFSYINFSGAFLHWIPRWCLWFNSNACNSRSCARSSFPVFISIYRTMVSGWSTWKIVFDRLYWHIGKDCKIQIMWRIERWRNFVCFSSPIWWKGRWSFGQFTIRNVDSLHRTMGCRFLFCYVHLSNLVDFICK